MEGCWRVEKVNVEDSPFPFLWESSEVEGTQKAFLKSANAQMTQKLYF